jgi:phage shock protein C
MRYRLGEECVMYCTNCGINLEPKANYCSGCGTATMNLPRRSHFEGRLTRSREDVKVAGVCAGFARYLGVDVALLRILWVVLTIFSAGIGLIVYVACWIVMPKEPLALPAGTMDAEPSHS